jgi:hypothetical protein
MNANGQENFGSVIYGKQSVIDAGARSCTATVPLTEGRERIEPPSHRSAADYP